MKRLLRILLLLLIFPIIVKADLQLRNYDDAVDRVNGYINDYSDRSKYLIFNQKYELKNGSNVNNSSFTMGGMISREEFELTKFKGSTYLEIGKQYWTLSTPTSNRAYKYYVDVTLRTKSEVEQSGVRATEYVKPAVGVSGKGTYSNPFIFEEGYLIDIRSNNPTYGKVNVSKTNVKLGESVDVTLVIANGYQYKPEKDNCGLTKITDTKYRLENINRDVTCTMVFEKAVYKFTLDNTQTYATSPNPNAIYYVYQVGWFSNPNATSGIDNINPPTKTGYIFKGYSYRSTSVIDSTGAIVAGNNMQLASDDWLKNNINLTLDGTAITYTVAYNANGGAGTMGSVTHTYDVAKTLSDVTFTRDGYEFVKWNTKADGSGTSYTDKQSVKNLSSTQGATVTLYAQWSQCNAGTYSNSSTPKCTPCAAGKISAAGASTCTNCPAGKYANGTGNTTCTPCAAGTYSLAGAGSCTTCPNGYTSVEGASALNQCYINIDSGKYLGSANSTTQTKCLAGTYKGAHKVYYGNTSSCDTCGAGTYSLTGAATCTQCPNGYTSTAGATAQNKCYISVSAGKYIATANSATQTPCPAGTYKGTHSVNFGNTSSCDTCEAGTYNTTTGNSTCTACPKGKYCTGGQNQTNCPAGKYRNATGGKTESDCSSCTAGNYSSAGSTTCTACAAGTYSGAGASTCTTCEAGTYNTTTGNSTCTACPKGKYCTGGQNQTNCPAGKYRNATGGKAESDCTTCEAGTYNTTAGQSSCTACPKGKYCTGGQNQTNCPAGKYRNATGGKTASDCSACSAGYYSEAGAATCTACPAGQYASGTGNTGCTKCTAGTYNTQTGQSECTKCPVGTYNPNMGSTTNQCTACPKGTYNNSTGQFQCTACGKGTYQDTTGQTSCKNCPSGQTTDGTGSTASSACHAPGYTCSAGYYLKANQTSCTKCIAGYACPGGTFQKKTTDQGISKCGEGKYSDAGASSCSSCPSGCTSAAGSDSKNDCYMSILGGYYHEPTNTCDGSSITKCPSNKVSSTHNAYFGQSDSGSCSACQSGYSPNTANTACRKIDCNDSACTLCSSASYCIKCSTGYTLSSGKCNMNCNVDHCSTCSSPNYCSKCQSGYVSNGSGGCKLRSASCFLAGTKIKTMFGYKDINELKVGDMVLTYNERLFKNEYKKVTKLHIHNDVEEELYKLIFDDNIDMQLTHAHGVYVIRDNNMILVKAQNVIIGDYVVYSNFEKHKVVKIEHRPINESVYNLSIQDNHNFYVGYNNVLVHNVPEDCRVGEECKTIN